MPAMLKGYFDRIWASGIAFEHDLEGGRIKPLLTHIKVFGVITTYGAPWLMTLKTLKPYWRRSRATGASALLIMFEDAHWFDTTSREALDLIIGQMPRLRSPGVRSPLGRTLADHHAHPQSIAAAATC
jgi:hypothetical protein